MNNVQNEDYKGGLPMASDTPPVGTGVLEYAAHRAAEALRAWDNCVTDDFDITLARAMVLAEETRKLLAELDADRRIRAGG